MKQIKENLNLIIGLLTVLFIGFIVYNSFFKSDVVSGSSEVVIGEIDPETKKIIEILDQIDNIEIDSKFFNASPDNNGHSLAFKELEDYSQPIPNKRPGKVNPFVKGGAINYIDQSEEINEETENNDVVQQESENQVVQEEIIQN